MTVIYVVTGHKVLVSSSLVDEAMNDVESQQEEEPLAC